MTDHLANLASKARARVARGYYDNSRLVSRRRMKLVDVIKECSHNPIITEIKYASPSSGKIRVDDSPLVVAKAMVGGGACALSVLTDPDNFDGNLDTLRIVAQGVPVPVLMKDIIVSPKQIRAGANLGADAVVLISEVFTRGLGEVTLDEMIEESSRNGLEVLAEANSPREFERLCGHEVDLYGINNRDLSTFKVELSRTEKILSETRRPHGPVVSESGIESDEDVRRLRRAGAEAFLVGTSVMRSTDIEGKVRELVTA